MLKIDNKWIWDFWLAHDGPYFHIFYLQAPKSLKLETKRHHNATIGHAVSEDLVHWQILSEALKPGNGGDWDDLATWTGSIIKKGNLWFMFYTGVNKKENGLIQRIGFATSEDLVSWEKYPNNPVIEADPNWYEMLDKSSWHDHAWRDPYVIFHENIYYAFITARAKKGLPDERGVIALAKSNNLLKWEVLPPISEIGNFGQLEVPQYLQYGKKHIIIFSSAIETTSKKRIDEIGQHNVKTGIFHLNSDNPLFGYKLPNNPSLMADKNGSLYSGKIILKNGKYYLLAFHNYDKNGNFLGFISDPIPIQIL